MPERPDLEYIVPILHERLAGQRIETFEVKKPTVLRVAIAMDASDALCGCTIDSVERRTHWVEFALTPAKGRPEVGLAVHLMLAGRFWHGETPKKSQHLALRFTLSDGQTLDLRDSKTMAKVYVFSPESRAKIPGLDDKGLDILDPADFTWKRFEAAARKRRDQAKVFLQDKAALDAFGNAYADETLFRAKIHPKAWIRKLSDDQLRALHAAMRDTLQEARDIVASRKPALDEKVRDFLNVRGRKGEACNECGTKIRVAGVRGYDAYFCPQCQPDGRGSSIVDWRKLGK